MQDKQNQKNWISFLHRRHLVDVRLQMAVLVYTLFVAILTVILTGSFFTISGISDLHEDQMFKAGILLAAGFVSFFLAFVIGFVLTNRIAGPIFRMRQHMRAIAAGKQPMPIAFRESDQFKGLDEDYNRIVGLIVKEEEFKPSN